MTVEAEPGEGCVHELWRTYVGRADREGRRVRTYRRRTSGCDLRAVTMWVGGAGAFGWLAGERGVRRIEPGFGSPPVRARVEVLPAAVSYDFLRVPDEEVRVETLTQTWGCGAPYPEWNGAVRLVHLPTGTDAFCEGQGTTGRNLAGAMTVLRARLLRLRTGQTAARGLGGTPRRILSRATPARTARSRRSRLRTGARSSKERPPSSWRIRRLPGVR